MNREIHRTRGLHEFVYTKEDIERIESTDTESTKDFKNKLRFKREHPNKFWWKYNKKKVLSWLILILLIVIGLLIMKQFF